MEVDQQVGLGEDRIEGRKQALEEAEFFSAEVLAGEEQGFGENIIGYGVLLEEVGIHQDLLELFVSFGHEEELYGKGVAFGIFVEEGEERIIGKLFEDQAGIKIFGQQLGERGFAGADISFNNNIITVSDLHDVSFGRLFFEQEADLGSDRVDLVQIAAVGGG